MNEQNLGAALGISKTVIGIATYTGAGAVAGALLKNADLSNVKGFSKICAGIGVMGISHWVAKNASETLSNEFDGVIKAIHDITAPKKQETAKEEVENE